MSHHNIPVAYQSPLYDRDTFLAPLQTPDAQAIITAAGVDTPRVKCYTVERVLRLYLFAAMFPGKMFHSLRGIVSLKDQVACRLFVGLSTWSLQGLSDANKRISFVVFQPLYQSLSSLIGSRLACSQVVKQFGPLNIFDCTHFQLALKLMPWGLAQNQRRHTGQLKCAVRLDSVAWVPDQINLDAQIRNDNTHFASLIDWTTRGVTYLFDRGFRKLAILVQLHERGHFFITRLHHGTTVTVVAERLAEPLRQGTLTIRHDQLVRLGRGTRATPPYFRLITAISDANGEPTTLYFLTNRTDLDPCDVASIYRYRWQIECFFKWLKHSLHLTHLFSYSENGVYLQLYVTLIFHLLLLHYHHQQKLSGQLGIATQRQVFNALCQTILSLGFFLGKATVSGDPASCPLLALPPGGEPGRFLNHEVKT